VYPTTKGGGITIPEGRGAGDKCLHFLRAVLQKTSGKSKTTTFTPLSCLTVPAPSSAWLGTLSRYLAKGRIPIFLSLQNETNHRSQIPAGTEDAVVNCIVKLWKRKCTHEKYCVMLLI
jgi:hypothetical protein